jgi:hypothetical protein
MYIAFYIFEIELEYIEYQYICNSLKNSAISKKNFCDFL